MSKALQTPSNLPAVQAPAVDVDTSRVGGVPFVTFISSKSPRFPELAASLPGLKEPDAVLIRPVPESPVKLDEFKVHLVTAKQYWATIEEDGTVTRVERTRPAVYDASLKEVIEAVLLVYVGDKIIPARATFKTTKCVGPAVAAKALKMAETAKWANESEAHARTMSIPVPFGRFTATFTCQQKTAKSTGRKYWLANARVLPTTAAEAKLLADHAGDQTFLSQLYAVRDSFVRRVSDLEEIAG